MRKRLRKKKDKQEVFDSVNWWDDNAAEEYIFKMKALRMVRTMKNLKGQLLTFPMRPIYPVSNCSSGMSMLFGDSILKTRTEVAANKYVARFDNQILQDILNTKRKG